MTRPPRIPGPAGSSRTAGHGGVDLTAEGTWDLAGRYGVETCRRGVHVAPYRVGGCVVLFAVDRHGERIAEVRVAPGAPDHTYADGETVSADRYAIVHLVCVLNEVDPEPAAPPATAPAAHLSVTDGGNRPPRERRRARPTLRVERGGAAPRRWARWGGDA